MEREIFSDRDESWVLFNERVLDQVDRDIPLAERIMFIGIAADNLDEFLMSRYHRRILNSPPGTDHSKVATMCEINHRHIMGKYQKFIGENGCPIIHEYQLSRDSREEALRIFEESIYPIVHPRKVINKLDSLSKQVNVFVELIDNKTNAITYSVIAIPEIIDQFYYLKTEKAYMPVEDFVVLGLGMIYRGLTVGRYTRFMVSRSVNMNYEHDEELDPMEGMEKNLKGLRKSKVMCVQFEGTLGRKTSLNAVVRKLIKGDKSDAVYLTGDFVGLNRLKMLDDSKMNSDDQRRSSEIYETFPVGDVFNTLKEGDQLVYHPFESFEHSVVRFIKQAAEDKNVTSIKMTLYRIPEKSKIINALLRARENNKAVTVMVELKARFNERANIRIARILEESGVEIIYSEDDIKTHAKMCVVTRLEKGKVKYYSHIGTGNYSDSNSKLYTDYSYFTSSSELGKDLVKFFSMLTHPGIERFESENLLYAPFTLRADIMRMIDREIEKAKVGKKAKIFFKCNALTDPGIASELYRASQQGVEIDLVIRGACIIRPGIAGVSENIRVRSLVGRYLEHSRVYAFGLSEKKDYVVYIGSADMMQRNLNRRFELLVRLRDNDLKNTITSHMNIYMKDNVNSYCLETLDLGSGRYSEFYTKTAVNGDGKKSNAHAKLAKLANKKRTK